MSWIRLHLGRGTLRIKPKRQMRSFEVEGVVPTLNLGFCVVSWWSNAAQERYQGGKPLVIRQHEQAKPF